MPIDLDTALNAPARTREIRWTERDVMFYHLSLGAGRGADHELGLTYEKHLSVLPTFAMVAGQGMSAQAGVTGGFTLPGVDIDLHRILHAGQAVTLHRPIPVSGTATSSTRVAEIWDKGKAAVIVTESCVIGPDEEPLWTSTSQIWARGEGGFGGEPGPETGSAAPDREPDLVVDTPTEPRQALLYRLNGDLNPLHADPDFAALAGLSAPILHGLASYGIVAKAVIDAALGGDPHRLTQWSVRFAGMVTPGETLRTSIWREDGGRLVVIATCPERDGAPVLTHGAAAYQD